MSFSDKSDVRNHLSTKHPLFSHRKVEVETPNDHLIESARDTQEPTINVPAPRAEGPLVQPS
jgi:hypothetical protein